MIIVKFLYVNKSTRKSTNKDTNKSKSRHWARGTNGSQSRGDECEQVTVRLTVSDYGQVSSFTRQFKMADEFQWRLFTNNLKTTVFINSSASKETKRPFNCVKSQWIWELFSSTFHQCRRYNNSGWSGKIFLVTRRSFHGVWRQSVWNLSYNCWRFLKEEVLKLKLAFLKLLVKGNVRFTRLIFCASTDRSTFMVYSSQFNQT